MIEIKNTDEALIEGMALMHHNPKLLFDTDNGDLWVVFKDVGHYVDDDNIIALSDDIKTRTGKDFYMCDKQMIEECATEAIKKRL